jgi:hypothetical protein
MSVIFQTSKVKGWLSDANPADNADSLIARCKVGASEIERLEIMLGNAREVNERLLLENQSLKSSMKFRAKVKSLLGLTQRGIQDG